MRSLERLCNAFRKIRFFQALGPIGQRGDLDFNKIASALMDLITLHRMSERTARQAQKKRFNPLAIRPRGVRRRL